MKHKKIFSLVGVLMLAVMVAAFTLPVSWAGMQDRFSKIELVPTPDNYVRMPELSSAPSTPASGWGKVYTLGNNIYFKDDAGVATSLIGAASGGVTDLDGAYDGGGAGAGAEIAIDAGPVIFTGTHASTPTTQLTASGSGNVIDIVNSGSGKDIDGTNSTWSFTKLGALVVLSIDAYTGLGDVTLDDGTGASPSLILKDATDELLTVSKVDSGYATFTTAAADGVSVRTGNLTVGNGTAGTAAMDGEDFYVEGDSEFDGACEFDGAVNIDGAVDIDNIVTLKEGLTIDNQVNNTLEWNENSEEIKWTFNSNDLALVSTTAVVELSFFDNAADAKLTHAADGAADDFYIRQTGAQNASLIIDSAGTAADALQITTSAGGIDITNGGAAGGEDLDIDAVLASLNLNADEDVAESITIVASTGGIDITADGAAAKDLDLVCTNGSTNLSGGEADAAAVTIAAGAGGIDITSAATFDIDITATGGKILGIASEAAADQFKIDAQGTIDGDAINLETTNGGVMLNADGASNGDIELNAADDLIFTAAGVLTIGVTGTTTVTNAATISGTTTLGAAVIHSGIQDVPAGGTTTVLALTNSVFTVGADAGGDIVTLANGTAGQIVYIICEDEAGTTTITPATFNGGTSITFNALGDAVTLVYTAGTGWSIVGGNSYTII